MAIEYMKTLHQIKKRLGIKIQETSLGLTQKHWVYKLSIEQVALIFEAGDLSCFGRNSKKKYSEFILEYNNLFNSGNDKTKFNNSISLIKMYTRHLKLRAMYDALTTCEAENSKAEFKKMFGKDFESLDDLKIVTDKASQLNDKMGMLANVKESKDGVSFVKLIIIIEDSRGKPISRSTKLYEFKEMYDIEIEKQGKAA